MLYLLSHLLYLYLKSHLSLQRNTSVVDLLSESVSHVFFSFAVAGFMIPVKSL